MRAVIHNFLQQDGELWARLSLKPLEKVAHVLYARDIAEKFGHEKALMLARFLHPPVVGRPFFVIRVATERRSPGFVEHKAIREGMRLLDFPVADAGAAYVSVETHVLEPRASAFQTRTHAWPSAKGRPATS